MYRVAVTILWRSSSECRNGSSRRQTSARRIGTAGSVDDLAVLDFVETLQVRQVERTHGLDGHGERFVRARASGESSTRRT